MDQQQENLLDAMSQEVQQQAEYGRKITKAKMDFIEFTQKQGWTDEEIVNLLELLLQDIRRIRARS